MSDQTPQLPPDSPRDLLDAYLDGQLDVEMRVEFEAKLQRDPTLRAQVEQQRAIDSSLQRSFIAPPISPALLSRLTHAVHAGNGKAAHPDRGMRISDARPPRVRRS